MPRLTSKVLRDAAKGVPYKKGFAGFCARWFAELSEGALELVATLLRRAEAQGCWPEQVRYSLLHLIPKKD